MAHRGSFYYVVEAVRSTIGPKFIVNVDINAGSTDVLLIFDEIPGGWDDMGTTENANDKSDSSTNQVFSVKAKDVEYGEQKKERHGGDVKPERKEGSGGDGKSEEKEEPTARPLACLKILFVILGILAVVAAIALIIVAILTCIATRAYDADQSSRIAALVFLVVTAAFTICMVIYMEITTFKRQIRRMVGACATIMILVIVQSLIGGISINIQPSDEAKLVKSLSESFKLAKEDVSRHYKLWAMTQSDLNCCGVYGPDDYRSQKQPYYFPPDVPISCCSTYDPGRSDLVQERERQLCKAKKTFFKDGCKDFVIQVFNETASLVLTVNVMMIIAEILLLIAGVVLSRKMKNVDNQVSPTPK